MPNTKIRSKVQKVTTVYYIYRPAVCLPALVYTHSHSHTHTHKQTKGHTHSHSCLDLNQQSSQMRFCLIKSRFWPPLAAPLLPMSITTTRNIDITRTPWLRVKPTLQQFTSITLFFSSNNSNNSRVTMIIKAIVL